MIRINLLPLRAERKKEDARRSVSIFILSLVAVGLVMGANHVSGMRRNSRLQAEVAKNRADITQFKKLAEQIKALQVQKSGLEAKLGVIKTLEKSKTGPVHLLDDLATRLPVQRLWLTGLEQKGEALTLKGEAVDNDSIAIYMQNLAGSRYVKGVDLISAEQKEHGGVKVMEFALTCQLSLTGEGKGAHPAGPALPGAPGAPAASPTPAGGPKPAQRMAQR